jgi:hypothetical protein
MWLDSGKPRHGWLNSVRLKAKADYKRVSKWVIRNKKKKLRADRMTEKLVRNQDRDFWKEVRNVRSNSGEGSPVIDSAVGDEELSLWVICREIRKTLLVRVV